MRTTLATLGSLIPLLGGCGPQPAETPTPPGYTLMAIDEPFSFAVQVDGEEVMREDPAGEAGTSLYFVTEGGHQHLTTPTSFVSTDTSLQAEYATDDGRTARLTIEPQTHGGLRLSLAFEPAEGILSVGETLVAHPEEHFHGLTERVAGYTDDVPRDPALPVALDRRGHHVEMVTRGTISLYAPFYFSSSGYGLFVEGTWTGAFDVAAEDNDRVRFQFDGPSLTYHVFPGSSPERILEQYTSVAGRPLLPPEWVFGHWRWRNDHVHLETLYDGTPYRGPINSQVYEDVKMMEKLDIPLDIYWVDRPWAVGNYGYDDFEWDHERLPSPETMIAWLEGRGVKFLLWIAPWMMGEMTEEALEKGYFLPSTGLVDLGLKRIDLANDLEFLQAAKPDLLDYIDQMPAMHLRLAAMRFLGQEVDEEDLAAQRSARQELRKVVQEASTLQELRRLLLLIDRGFVLLDFTNPEAVAWWHRYLDKVLTMGVKGFKLDRADEIVPADRDVFAHDGRSMAEVHNQYPVLYTQATFEGAQRVHGDDFVLLPRAGYTGSQRYGVFWAGDSMPNWLGLRNAYIGGLRASLMGFPLWGSDTGGYFYPTDRFVLARWLALSAFSPIMEVGPTTNRAPWDMPTGPGYDAELIATWRLYAKLHAHLKDYAYRYAQEAHETGHPVMRPLFYGFPRDQQAWQIWDEYLYGDDYLVAPVLSEGASERQVYLPAGTWIDYWEPGVSHVGPETVTVATPFHKTPIFLRAGSDQEILDLNALYQESLEIARTPPRLDDGSEIGKQ